jgi:hypothetical protein
MHNFRRASSFDFDQSYILYVIFPTTLLGRETSKMANAVSSFLVMSDVFENSVLPRIASIYERF